MGKCKWWHKECYGEFCKRHAPIVIPNPNFCKDNDRRAELTCFPEALCPCGDIDEQRS